MFYGVSCYLQPVLFILCSKQNLAVFLCSNTQSRYRKRPCRKCVAPACEAVGGPTEGKLSALYAAAQVLGNSAELLNTKQMVEQMAAKGLWTSPGGKTPHATLYAAILREIQVKGKEARFKKTERGQFAANG